LKASSSDSEYVLLTLHVTQNDKTHLICSRNGLRASFHKCSRKRWTPYERCGALGVFRDKTLQALYTALTAKGSADVWAAYQVGIEIENLDISDLKNMLDDPMPADMKLALERLRNGSINHLSAFSR
jgi:hypothetical protein